SANNTDRQLYAVISDGVEVYLQNPKLICTVGTGATGIHSSEGYVRTFEVDGGQIAGCAVAITGSGSQSGLSLTRTVLQNEVNIDMLPRNATFDNVTHVPLGNYRHQYVVFGNGVLWNPKNPLPMLGVSYWAAQRGSRFVVKNWQGTGKDYLLF